MFSKLLTLSALLSVSQAKDFSDKEKEGLDLASGFFAGSGTITKEPNMDELKGCMQYLDHIYGYADDGYPLLFSNDLSSKLQGVKKIAHMIHMIRSSQSQCQKLNADWDKINKMSDAWRNPKDVSFNNNRLSLHGMDLEDQLGLRSQAAWAAKDYETVGEELGRASLKLINNGKLIDQGKDPSSGSSTDVDPKKVYFQKMGAEFASGFLFGIRIGGFNEDELYDCMLKEEKAYGIFLNADMEMKKAIQYSDNELAVKALEDMVRYIYDLAEEKGTDGVKICPSLTKDESKLNESKKIIRELTNPKRKIQMKGGILTFNKEDVSEETELFVNMYVQGNYKALGYTFANMLHKHSHYSQSKRRILHDPTIIY